MLQKEEGKEKMRSSKDSSIPPEKGPAMQRGIGSFLAAARRRRGIEKKNRKKKKG